VNVAFVPRYGYMACAWGGVAGYGTAMVLSYVVGQKYYPLNYPVRDMMLYVVLAAAIAWMMMTGRTVMPLWASLVANTVGVMLFVGLILRRDLPLASLPVVGKYFRHNKAQYNQ